MLIVAVEQKIAVWTQNIASFFTSSESQTSQYKQLQILKTLDEIVSKITQQSLTKDDNIKLYLDIVKKSN